MKLQLSAITGPIHRMREGCYESEVIMFVVLVYAVHPSRCTEVMRICKNTFFICRDPCLKETFQKVVFYEEVSL